MKISFDTIKPGLNWQGSQAKNYIEQSGSKAGVYQYLQDTNSKLREHLPTNTHYLAPNEDIEKFLDKIDLDNLKVIRACHSLDFLGMVDVIPTKVRIHSRNDIRKAIHEIYKNAKSKEVKDFVNYEFDLNKHAISFDGEIGILVQDYFNCRFESGSSAIGSIIEHPHEKGIYRVSVTQDDFVEEVVCNEEALCLKAGDPDCTEFKYAVMSPYLLKSAMLLYKQVQSSGLIPNNYSFQMEFGYGKDDVGEQINLFQARLFKPYEPKAEFEPECYRMSLPYGAFGITPDSGVEMKIYSLDEFTYSQEEMKSIAGNIAYRSCKDWGDHEELPLSIKPENIGAYLVCNTSPNSMRLPKVLQHGDYRWAQKAPITLMLNSPLKSRDLRSVKVFSNGVIGGIDFV